MGDRMSERKKTTRWTTFITDKDGMTARDFLVFISIGVYFFFLSAGLTVYLFGRELDAMYLGILDSAMPVVITVVGGVMAVQGVESFKRPAKQIKTVEETEPTEPEPMPQYQYPQYQQPYDPQQNHEQYHYNPHDDI